jgi:hypothetical protein
MLFCSSFNLFNFTNIAGVNTMAFTYLAAGSGACAGHANACMVPGPSFLAPTSTGSLIWGPRQLQVSARVTF